ncbi:MAG: hypothetical protein ACXVA9_02550 [Bdellovibrionales bacterium]
MERKPYSSESMRVRCPHCRKLYLVQFNDIKEAKPRFECVQCHERFWLSLPDMDLNAELQGLPVKMKEVPPAQVKRPDASVAKSAEPCPKCFKIVQTGTSECPYCGVLINKMKELAFTEDGMPRSENLSIAWKKVLANYSDDTVHAEFMRIAQRERNLPFAAAQYGQILKLMPTDETTRKRMTEVQLLASVMIPGALRAKVRGQPSRLWHVPLFASVLMMIVGVFVPVFRNMTGVGAAFFFLALAFQIQFRRREP